MVKPPTISIDEAMALVSDGNVMVTAMAACEPQLFFENIHRRVRDLKAVKIYCANPSRAYPCFVDDGIEGNVEILPMFLTPAVSRLHGHGFVHYVPQHLSQWVENMRRRGSVDIFWGCCSPPDSRGFVNLGLSSVYEREVLAAAKLVILEVNERMPVTHGSTSVSLSEVDYLVSSDRQLPAVVSKSPEQEDLVIGNFVADLIADGSTLQLGIGSIPNAIGESLRHKKDLGVHTEMINDVMVELYEAGVITGRCKSIWPAKMIGAFAFGTQRLYDFVHDNPAVELHPASVVNNPMKIAANHQMISVNTAVEIDITGQVCSEAVGHRQLSGVGGAFDTHYGAQRAVGGRGIIAMRSLANDHFSPKIVFELKPGSKVSIGRNDTDTVVTEYGVAELRGRSVAERIKALIAIAHPKTRDELLFLSRREGYL